MAGKQTMIKRCYLSCLSIVALTYLALLFWVNEYQRPLAQEFLNRLEKSIDQPAVNKPAQDTILEEQQRRASLINQMRFGSGDHHKKAESNNLLQLSIIPANQQPFNRKKLLLESNIQNIHFLGSNEFGIPNQSNDFIEPRKHLDLHQEVTPRIREYHKHYEWAGVADFENVKPEAQPSKQKKSYKNEVDARPPSSVQHMIRKEEDPTTNTSKNSQGYGFLEQEKEKEASEIHHGEAVEVHASDNSSDTQQTCVELASSFGLKIVNPEIKFRPVAQIEKQFPWLSKGGHFTPRDCIPKEKTAIVIPYRNRQKHLHILLLNLLPILKAQNVDFTILIVEQELPGLFNRGMLFNVGFLEAMKLDKFDCFIFHDVDLIPLNEANFYHCNENPTSFLGGVNKFNYSLMYQNLFGGVEAFTRHQFEAINGASNFYFGWGAEDDDLRLRILKHNMSVLRTHKDVGLYDMINHGRETSNPKNPIRYWLLKSGAKRSSQDGLNTAIYETVDVQQLTLYTWLKVKINATLIIQESKYFGMEDKQRLFSALAP